MTSKGCWKNSVALLLLLVIVHGGGANQQNVKTPTKILDGLLTDDSSKVAPDGPSFEQRVASSKVAPDGPSFEQRVASSLAVISEDKEERGRCIWYGTCDNNPEPGKEKMLLNCANTTEAILLNDPFRIYEGLLMDFCPDMVNEIKAEYNGELRTCCDVTQISIMTTQLGMLQSFVGRCPACYRNLLNTFCYFTCSPHNSEFLLPTTKYENSIQSVEYYMNDDHVTDIFESCDEVFYPDMGVPALTMLCGPWGSAYCTPHRLFEYFGNNEFAPFNITYQYSNTSTMDSVTPDMYENNRTMLPYNRTANPCNVDDDQLFCLCSDCRDSCPPLPSDPPAPYHPMVGEIELLTFLCIIAFIVETALIVTGYVYLRTRKQPRQSVDTVHLMAFKEKKSAIPDSLPQPSFVDIVSASLEKALARNFSAFATLVAKYPVAVIGMSLAICIALIAGMSMLKITTDPVRLWASPTSRSRNEKQVFDEKFRPFYRTAQIIMVPKGNISGHDVVIVDPNLLTYNYHFGPALDQDFVMEAMILQNQIQELVGDYDGQEVRMQDVCTRPLYPQSDDCVIMSVTNYWQNNITLLQQAIDTDTFDSTIVTCVNNPTNSLGTYCLGSYGGPVIPYTALGGFLEDDATSLSENPDYFNSTALIITMTLENQYDKSMLGPALAWEAKFLEFMAKYSNDMMDIAYNAERGIEDELMRESVGDLATIAVSYILMFGYITLALGNLSADCSRMMIESKVMVGLGGVSIVLLAVCASLGFYGYVGVEATLFVIEVVPFLVLAVGVDNIFILVQTYQRNERLKGETIEEHVGRVVGKVGPSILVSTCSEALCFFLGALSDMPAVYSFSLYAAMALVIDFMLQMTCFVALITLDAKRMEDDRYDVICCVKASKKGETKPDPGVCFNVIKEIYAPFLLKGSTKVVVLVAFSGLLLTNAAFIPHISVGLEQDLSMPEDSFVLKYFDYLNKYLCIGPPVYFVITEGFDFSDVDNQNLICSSSGCDLDSMLTQVFVSSLKPNVTLIGSGANSWLEAYLGWISDAGGGGSLDMPIPPGACCRLDENGTYIDSSAQWDEDAKRICLNKTQFTKNPLRPKPENFMTHLPDFLIDNPHGTVCPQAGHPAYGEAVEVIEASADRESRVGASYFMAYHTILRTSKDFIAAMDQVYQMTDKLTEYLHNKTYTTAKVFPYSIFYVYYEQYLTMWEDTLRSLAISLCSVFAVMVILTGLDVWSSSIVLLTITMILVNMMGMMCWWNVQLNAVTLVNLVMAVGISVEFCSHTTHAFATSIEKSRDLRARDALAKMGSSVLSGITLTKFVGIIVLAFAQSQIFRIFYFRMYFGMVVFGGLHGLVLLPVLLSIAGPSVNKMLVREMMEKEIYNNFTQSSVSEMCGDNSRSQSTTREMYDNSKRSQSQTRELYDNLAEPLPPASITVTHI